MPKNFELFPQFFEQYANEQAVVPHSYTGIFTKFLIHILIFPIFRLKISQPIKNQSFLNPESAIYRAPTSVSTSEVAKSRQASKYQVSKYRPCVPLY